MFTQHDLLTRVMMLIPMVLSLSVHEWAHAWSASKLGDDTAERQGRLTLNPIVHIDPIGTLLLPLLGVPFGWARPVPVNPTRFRRSVNMRTGMAITAAAGPLSNFILAVLSAVILGVWLRTHPMESYLPGAATTLMLRAITLNLALGMFNLLPVPPLDGSRIASRFLGDRFPRAWGLVEQYSPFLLIGTFFAASFLLARPLAAAQDALLRLVLAVAGI